MSYFINSMFSPGLSEIPPESKVTPFPTNASKPALSSAPFDGVYLSTISLPGSSDPRATLSKDPIPSCSMRASSSTSTLRPNSPATSRARSDMIVGVILAPGSFARSLVKLTDSPIILPRSTPRLRPVSSAPAITTTSRSICLSSLSTVRYLSGSNSDINAPSITTDAISSGFPSSRGTMAIDFTLLPRSARTAVPAN